MSKSPLESRRLLWCTLMLVLFPAGLPSAFARPAPPTSAVEVKVMVDAVDVQQIAYEVREAGRATRRGTLEAAPAGALTALRVPGVRRGSTVDLRFAARSADGRTTCRGGARILPTATGHATAEVALLCQTASRTAAPAPFRALGSCPAIESYSASARSTPVGAPILLQATAADDGAPARRLRFHWASRRGSFSTPDEALTWYQCGQDGDRIVTLEVSNGWCSHAVGLRIQCGEGEEELTTALRGPARGGRGRTR